ncbi:MAG TPA: hypothetical protein VFL59_08395 [Candidatus Nanopelagicales bacterium]|nr:hypothetical protein [Candidatus Nanopelagicales bacterium]
MDASPSTEPAPADVLGAAGVGVPFRCGPREVTYADALESLALRGAWSAVVEEVGGREAALLAAEGRARSALDAGIPALEQALRRRLRLTSADDYVVWLGRWALTVDACRDHLRRQSVEPMTAGDAPAVALRAHVVIEGVLDDAVRRLAQDAALAGADSGSTTWLADVVAAAEAARREDPVPSAVADLVAEHLVDWTRVDATVVVAADDDVAHELLLCVREQHTPLLAVAHGAGLAPTELAATLDDVEDWLEPALVGAEPGALLGPLAHPSGRAVVELIARTVPDENDEVVRRRAREELLERRAAVAMSQTIRWSAGA